MKGSASNPNCILDLGWPVSQALFATRTATSAIIFPAEFYVEGTVMLWRKKLKPRASVPQSLGSERIGRAGNLNSQIFLIQAAPRLALCLNIMDGRS